MTKAVIYNDSSLKYNGRARFFAVNEAEVLANTNALNRAQNAVDDEDEDTPSEVKRSNQVALDAALARPVTHDDYAKKYVPDGLGYAIIDDTDFPADRDFRDAWVFDAGSIQADVNMAREVSLKRKRLAREPLLADLDLQFMQALEKGEDTRAIATEKQTLRDSTEAIKDYRRSGGIITLEQANTELRILEGF